jgi:hypothetical protein
MSFYDSTKPNNTEYKTVYGVQVSTLKEANHLHWKKVGSNRRLRAALVSYANSCIPTLDFIEALAALDLQLVKLDAEYAAVKQEFSVVFTHIPTKGVITT